MKDKRLLIRLSLNADGKMSIDETGKAHGRGAYLCKDNADCFQQARKSKGLERSLSSRVPENIFEKLKME